MTNKKRVGVIAICITFMLSICAVNIMALAEKPAESSDSYELYSEEQPAESRDSELFPEEQANELSDSVLFPEEQPDEWSDSYEFNSEVEPGLEQLRGTFEITMDDDGKVIDETSFQEYTLDGGVTWNELVN
jgi:hypothetical protein